MNGDEKLYECVLKLPPNAPVLEVISPPHVKSAVAKQLVCMEACKRLHQIGALDDYLQPNSDELRRKQSTNSENDAKINHAGMFQIHSRSICLLTCEHSFQMQFNFNAFHRMYLVV